MLFRSPKLRLPSLCANSLCKCAPHVGCLQRRGQSSRNHTCGGHVNTDGGKIGGAARPAGTLFPHQPAGHRVGQIRERQGTCLTRGSRGHSPAGAEGHLHPQEWPRVRGKRRNQKRSENSPALRLSPCRMASPRVPTPARTHTRTPHGPDAVLRMPGCRQSSQGLCVD